MNLVLGQNGTGKTTLLELIVCAVNLNFDRYETEELDVAFELADANRQASATFRFINAPAKPHYPDVAPVRDTLARTIRSTWRCGNSTIQLDFSQNKLVLTGLEEPISPSDIELTNYNSGIVYLANALRDQSESFYSFVSPFAFRFLFLARRVRFDESLSYVTNLISSESLQLTNNSRFDDLDAVLETSGLRRALRKSFAGEQRALSTSSDVPFLTDATRLFRASAITAELSFNQSKPAANNRMLFLYKGLNFILTRGRSTITFENFSYGQKRLLGALHYFSVNTDIIVADELTNGLHHEWIDFLIKELGERQSFLTSQNPVLLDFLTFDSAADVSQRLIRCTMNDDGELHWCNIPSVEAEDFFITYSANMQQVGEIMRIQGLW